MKINSSAAYRNHLSLSDFTANRKQIPPQVSQPHSSSLNSRVAAATTLSAMNRLQASEVELDPQLENQRKTILELLSQYRWELDHLMATRHCDQDSAVCTLAQSLCNSIAMNIRMVRLTTSRHNLRQIVDKLQSIVLDISTRVQDIASPPLLTRFMSLRIEIFQQLSASAFDRTRLLTHRDEIFNRIDRILSSVAEAKRASAGQLSRKFIRKLQWGYENQEIYLLLAKWNIRHAQSHEDIHRELNNLRRSIVRGDRTLKSVLRSPQRNLKEKVFGLLGKLYAARRELGETVVTPTPQRPSEGVSESL